MRQASAVQPRCVFEIVFAAALLLVPARDLIRADQNAQDTASSPAARTSAALSEIAQEALADARSAKDARRRAAGLLEAASVLDHVEPALTAAALDEARRVIPDIPDKPFTGGPTPGTVLGDSFYLQGSRPGIDAPTTGSGWNDFAVSMLNAARYGAYVESYRAKADAYAAAKTELIVRLADLWSDSNSVAAVATAMSITDPNARGVALRYCLSNCQSAGCVPALAAVRQYAADARSRTVSPAVLSELAVAAQPQDPDLARGLVALALDKLRSDRSGSEATYASVAKADPSRLDAIFNELSARPAENAESLLSFSRGVLDVDVDLAWRSFKSVDRGNDWTLGARTALLKRFADVERRDLEDEVRAYALEVLALPSKSFRVFISGGAMLREARRASAVSDAAVALGTIDPAAARAAADAAVFHSWIGGSLIDGRPRRQSGSEKEVRDQFPRNVARLELALSWLAPRPLEAFDILDSLRNDFWNALSLVATRDSFPLFGLKSPEELNSRFRNVLNLTKTAWSAAANRLDDTQREAALRTFARAIEVSEVLDTFALQQLAPKTDRRQLWVEYLPLALTQTARALHDLDANRAAATFERARMLSMRLPSPMREWALWSNAITWQEVGTDASRRAVLEAAERSAALKTVRPFSFALPSLVEGIAPIDLTAALHLARTEERGARAAALAAIVRATAYGPRLSPNEQAPEEPADLAPQPAEVEVRGLS